MKLLYEILPFAALVPFAIAAAATLEFAKNIKWEN
jgi:hypothetical protein